MPLPEYSSREEYNRLLQLWCDGCPSLREKYSLTWKDMAAYQAERGIIFRGYPRWKIKLRRLLQISNFKFQISK